MHSHVYSHLFEGEKSDLTKLYIVEY